MLGPHRSLKHEALASELVAARREASALRREVDRPRGELRPDATAWAPVRKLVSAMRCKRCGLTLHRGAVVHDQALVFASCCPRCDGPLVDALGPTESSVYLG